MNDIKASLEIFFSLFKNSLLVAMGLVFITFAIITIIPIVINSYNESLEKSLATKQPHIRVSYINEKQHFTQKELSNIEAQMMNSIGADDIKEINLYVQERLFVKFKCYGNNLSEYNGFVETIGLSKYHYPITYDFESFEPVMLSDYGFKITGLEMFEEFKNHKDTIFFNKSLYMSIQPLVTYEANFEMEYFLDSSDVTEVQGNFLGIVEDFFEKPIIYMDYQYLNEILGHESNHISGFMININDQNKLYEIKQKLELFFNYDEKKVIVSTWRELNKKQNDIFKIFTQVGAFLKWIILILAITAVSVYLYKSLLMKQPQLRLLNILGLRLVSIVNTTIVLLSAFTVTLASISVHFALPYFYNLILGIDLDVSIWFYLGDVLFSYLVLVSVVVIMVKSLFQQQYNIFK